MYYIKSSHHSAMMSHYLLSSWIFCAFVILSTRAVEVQLQDCPSNGCPTLSDIDLNPLQGVWETVYYRQAEGEENPDIPNFFNISLCAPLSSPSSCTNSRVCYSEHLSSFSDLGQNCRYKYDTGVKQVQFVFDYAPGLVYGSGNVSVTLICGRTLGVPEVLEGDPDSHAINILWVTSAACKNSSSLATDHEESKCYHVHPYLDNGLKANFIDLTDLIRPEGYSVSYPERPASNFLLSVCRPLKNVGECSGSLACLNQTDPGFNSGVSAPTKLGIFSSSSQLYVEGSLLTIVYSISVKGGACFDSDSNTGNHTVKIHFICPTGNEDLGPRITFLDDDLCLLVVHWYTSYACGNAAIQSTGCTLTTSLGQTYDLTGLSSQQNVSSNTQFDSSGGSYQYEFTICSQNSVSTGCASRDEPIHIAQVDNDGVCRVLGVGAGKLRYVDGELTLEYGMGDPCHTNFARTTIIHFICPENVESNSSVITFSGEENCFYEFEWVTPLACGAQTSGASSCQFESLGSMYNFAPLVGTEDENWIVLDTTSDTECFMINPCGTLSVAPDPHTSPAGYCNAKLAPQECSGSSVCQIKTDGSLIKIGNFHFGSSSTVVHNADSNVITVVGNSSSLSAVVHYVCKVGDFTTPPIFIGITNDVLYEFHWMTYAACPTGIEYGTECTVTHHSTGFVFNLTSLPVISINKEDYKYTVSMCKPLSNSASPCASGTGVCQSHGTKSYSLGNANSTLVYEDGTLKLHYTGGTKCHHNGNPSRNTTLVFVCDNTAHDPVINDIDEDYCNYVIEIRTKKACPPAYQAHSCVHFVANNSFDFSTLARASGSGNWETRGRDGSLYYINVCQPLNSIPGCNPLAAICRVKTSGTTTTYTNIALASSVNFTALNQSGENSINLKYQYKNVGDGLCSTVNSIIHFTCSKSSLNEETGPTYVSGGDDASPCDYLFTWETVYACSVHPITSNTCSVSSPSGFTFNLSPLSFYNSTLSYFSLDSSAGYTYHMSICSPLDHPCKGDNDNQTVAVCQKDSKNAHICGLSKTQHLTYFDGSLTMTFKGGEICKQNKKPRSVLINFECDRTLADYKGYPHFVAESEHCSYTFDWPTALACLPQELECVADGGKYNLQPLLQQQVWTVRGLGNGYNYVIGGCRSLDFVDVPNCPQKVGMGACRYRDGQPGSGTALGFINSDIIVESHGTLVLTYTTGECANGNGGVVRVHFLCGESVGEPTLVEDDTANCVVRIDWTTKYACPRDSKVSSWFVEDPVTHQLFNLSTLPPFLSSNYTEKEHHAKYNYTVGLGGNSVDCRQGNADREGIGACQRTLTPIEGHTHSVHSLGSIGNNTLQYVGGEISVEYLHGDECHHISKERKTVVSFVCEQARDAFLEVFPEKECEYSFAVHTDLVCKDSDDIGIPCTLPRFANLDVFQSYGMAKAMINDTAAAFFTVCSTLDDKRPPKCPKGAAACIINSDLNRGVHLGKPNPKIPPKPLSENEGVLIEYTAGEPCEGGQYHTKLVLICNRNIPIGTPEFVDDSDCVYTFKWESINACPINLTYTVTSKNICSIDDGSSEFVYDFTNLVKTQQIYAYDSRSDTTYYIQLCGTVSKLPSVCKEKDTGICVKGASDETGKALVKAMHKIILTSHSPHTVEIVFTTGKECGVPHKTWTAVVSLQCASRESSTNMPVFQSSNDCRLDFVWQNSSFCVGEKSCAVSDSHGHVYNFDGLFSQTWTGIVTSDSAKSVKTGGTFTMSVCRNLNPFSSSGSHCSSPAGICFHSPDGQHVNLGHMAGPPKVQTMLDTHPTIEAVYSGGDICNATTGARYSTTLFLHCASKVSTPILSLHEDVSNGNCSWTVAMETPLACAPSPSQKNYSGCVMSTSEGDFDFTALGKRLNFTSGGSSYSVCLCSSQCPTAFIKNSTSKQNLGALNNRNPVFSSVTGGPRLTFTGGDNCGSSGKGAIQTMIFMECNRSADLNKGELTYQADLSNDCHKYFFWSTPYACVSEEVSCSVATDKNGILYDFSPLQSLGKPWKVTSGYKEYYINVCGVIENRKDYGLEECGPQSSVCVKDGSKVTSLATTSTQRIQVSGENVFVRFSGPKTKCGDSHVSIIMKCGMYGLGLNGDFAKCYANSFVWSTPYACGENKAVVSSDCNVITSLLADSYYTFQPEALIKETYKIKEGNTTYNIRLCGSAPECGKDVSICDDKGNDIASFKHQTIMGEGYQLLFQMSDPAGLSHAIVRVACLIDVPEPNPFRLENIGKQNEHTYYYFALFIRGICTFDLMSTSPPAITKSPQAVAPANGSTIAVLLTVLALLLVLVIVLVLVFYKKSRRVAAKLFLERLAIGKADEPVKYHKLSHQEDEETALMGDSTDSDSSDSSVNIFEERNGAATKVDVDIAPENKETNSDEELINI